MVVELEQPNLWFLLKIPLFGVEYHFSIGAEHFEFDVSALEYLCVSGWLWDIVMNTILEFQDFHCVHPRCFKLQKNA